LNVINTKTQKDKLQAEASQAMLELNWVHFTVWVVLNTKVLPRI